MLPVVATITLPSSCRESNLPIQATRLAISAQERLATTAISGWSSATICCIWAAGDAFLIQLAHASCSPVPAMRILLPQHQTLPSPASAPSPMAQVWVCAPGGDGPGAQAADLDRHQAVEDDLGALRPRAEYSAEALPCQLKPRLPRLRQRLHRLSNSSPPAKNPRLARSLPP